MTRMFILRGEGEVSNDPLERFGRSLTIASQLVWCGAECGSFCRATRNADPVRLQAGDTEANVRYDMHEVETGSALA